MKANANQCRAHEGDYAKNPVLSEIIKRFPSNNGTTLTKNVSRISLKYLLFLPAQNHISLLSRGVQLQTQLFCPVLTFPLKEEPKALVDVTTALKQNVNFFGHMTA